MRFGSLFSGIGGMDLGLERAGMECAWQVEIDPFCRKVLTKHWPNVPKFEDVKEVGKHNLERVDLIAGGFPCQDISYANNQATGIDGVRSGLWSEYARIIDELRPRYILVENVAALLGRGMGRVLGDLASCGYDAEWRVFSACEMGFSHSRERLFLVAYPAEQRCFVASFGKHQETSQSRSRRTVFQNWQFDFVGQKDRRAIQHSRRRVEPSLLRVADGVPDRVERIRAIGNAVVPQVAEWIGKRIIESPTEVKP